MAELVDVAAVPSQKIEYAKKLQDHYLKAGNIEAKRMNKPASKPNCMVLPKDVAAQVIANHLAVMKNEGRHG